MRQGMRKFHALKARRFAARLFKLNGYLSIFMGLDVGKFVFDAELNKILLHTMPNIQGKQVLIQGFDFESETFNRETSMNV